MAISPYFLTGYLTKQTYKEKIDKDLPAVAYNTLIFLGYIPIVGAVTGAVHIFNGNTPDNDLLTKSGRVYLIVRGIFELLGLGLLFLIPDVAVTMHRFCCTQRANTTS